MTRKEWSRRRLIAAIILMPLGLALAVLGAFNSTGANAMLAIAVGSVGVLLITFGALAGRLAIAGPFPSHLEADPSDLQEADG